ncbi:hypothetical protein COX69_00140 [Candidatus Falkowbacteria bacterium CG_4_10_14_0_2_um_filter_48_10]|nr:MAG: hypothetical protein COX69_00140 [Candidatus Falkowbacteria bacterium CG_4_10_14_0_2_um_filter_48_10]
MEKLVLHWENSLINVFGVRRRLVRGVLIWMIVNVKQAIGVFGNVKTKEGLCPLLLIIVQICMNI